MPSSEPLEMMIETFSMVAGLAAVFSATISVAIVCTPYWRCSLCQDLSNRSPAHPGEPAAEPALLDAAAGFRDSGDPGRDLGRPLREELIQVLDRDVGALAERPHRRSRPFLEVLLAHEPNHLPVLFGQWIDAFAARQLGYHRFGPLIRVNEEAFAIQRH